MRLHGRSWNLRKIRLPENIYIVTAEEVQQIKDIAPAEILAPDDISSRVAAPHQTLEVDALLRAQQETTLQENQTIWHIAVSVSLCAVVSLGDICYFFLFLYKKQRA
jgi:hypothetical protein